MEKPTTAIRKKLVIHTRTDKPKFLVYGCWKNYRDVISVDYPEKNFNTLEEAETYVNKELAQRIGQKIIVQVFDTAQSVSKIINADKAANKKFAYFEREWSGNGGYYWAYRGVVEGFDRKDVKDNYKIYGRCKILELKDEILTDKAWDKLLAEIGDVREAFQDRSNDYYGGCKNPEEIPLSLIRPKGTKKMGKKEDHETMIKKVANLIKSG
jgi:hypothetical protein